MKKAALLALGPLCAIALLACPTEPGGSGTTTITSEGSYDSPVVLQYTGYRQCQIDGTSPSWYQFTIPEDYTLRIKLDDITPALDSGEFLDVYISENKDDFPSTPTFVVTSANMGTYHDFTFTAGTHYIKVLEWPGKSMRFGITMGMGNSSGDDDDDPLDPDDPGTGGDDEGEGSGTNNDPYILELDTARTLNPPASGSDTWFGFDAAASGNDYTLSIELLDGTAGGSVYIDSDSNSMVYNIPVEDTDFSCRFSAKGDGTRINLNAVPGDIRVTVSEADMTGRWELVGAEGFSTADVIGSDMALTYNPTTGELWAASWESRDSGNVIAVYRAGGDNDSWTEVSGFPALDSPSQPSIAVDSQGTVYVGCAADFGDHVYPALYRYDGSSWTSVGDVQYGPNPSPLKLLVDADDTLHVLGSCGEEQGFELYYYTLEGSTLTSVDFQSDIDGYNFDAVLDNYGNVRLGLSWYKPFQMWSDTDFIEEDYAEAIDAPDRGTVRMASASDGRPWAILRTTIAYNEHQYQLWRKGDSDWESVYDFPPYTGYSQEVYINGLALSSLAPAILSREGDQSVYSVWGYQYSTDEMVLLGEHWLAYSTLSDVALVSGKNGALYVYGKTFTSEEDPADGRMTVYKWVEQN